jgi:hypothetical protein
MAHIQVGVPKLPRLGLPRLRGAITLRTDLWWKWGLKQSCSLHQELSNGMLHVTLTQITRVDSWLLVVESQIANSTPCVSFGHNFCFRCPNGWCKHVLDIYVPRAFHWYKQLLKPLSFDPWNCPLKIWESIGTPTPNVGVPLGVWWSILSHSLALPGACGMIPKLPSWPTTLQPFALVTSPRLGLWHQWYQKIKFLICI